MKDNEEVKKYWEERAKASLSQPNATTDDFYLRKLEINTFVSQIIKLQPLSNDKITILDVGCGDGFTTIEIMKLLPNHFVAYGCDYSANMIKIANENLSNTNENLQSRIHFQVVDALEIDKQYAEQKFNFIITDRCLINLTTTAQQFEVIRNIHALLEDSGYYIGIENFIDGQDILTSTRLNMGLPEIPVRWHNLFFNDLDYKTFTGNLFASSETINFSSAYYFATRIIYSKYAQMLEQKPNYFHEIHKLAIDLPICGNFSPIKISIHKK